MNRLLALAFALLLPACSVLTKPCSSPPPGPKERCTCIGGLWYCDPLPSPSPSPGPSPSPSTPPSPLPEPTPISCPVVHSFGPALPGAAKMVTAVDNAVLDVTVAHPELFDLRPDGRFLIAWPTDPKNPEGERKAQEFYRLVQKALLARGVCSVYIDQDPTVKDEIQVLAGGGRSEGYHLVNFGAGRVNNASEAFKGGIAVTTVGPLPSPTPTPSPSPSASPAPSVCRLDPDPSRLRAKGRVRVQANTFADATFEYFYGTKDDGSPAGLCGRRWCDLGVDGGEDGKACADTLIGTPQWSVASGTMEIEPGFLGNPYFARIVSGHGVLHVCSERLPTSCGDIAVP